MDSSRSVPAVSMMMKKRRDGSITEQSYGILEKECLNCAFFRSFRDYPGPLSGLRVQSGLNSSMMYFPQAVLIFCRASLRSPDIADR
ncbi:hypothetical protein MKMG_01266 [Methanogenium sp. MK-MG]|nr:hypothetical protein MKMG_01266 [Methanogenium sp. MK-MG]